MTNEQTLKFYENKKAEIEQQLLTLIENIRQVKLAIIKEKYNIEIGSVVTCRNSTYKITEINLNHGTRFKPWIKGNLKKKDGSWGTGNRELYDDWELIGE